MDFIIEEVDEVVADVFFLIFSSVRMLW